MPLVSSTCDATMYLHRTFRRYANRTPIAHRIAVAVGSPARPPQGAQRERQGRRQGGARVRVRCTRRRLVRRRRLLPNKGLPPSASTSRSPSPSKSTAAIQPVIALPPGSVMLVGKVPSPALISTRLGLPSPPRDTTEGISTGLRRGRRSQRGLRAGGIDQRPTGCRRTLSTCRRAITDACAHQHAKRSDMWSTRKVTASRRERHLWDSSWPCSARRTGAS